MSHLRDAKMHSRRPPSRFAQLGALLDWVCSLAGEAADPGEAAEPGGEAADPGEGADPGVKLLPLPDRDLEVASIVVSDEEYFDLVEDTFFKPLAAVPGDD